MDALAQAGVRLPVGGPELSDPTETGWLQGLIGVERGRLAFVSAHRYPLSACQTDRAASDYPTISRLLGEGASTGLARSVKAAVLTSHRAGLPFRLTEFNAVTCGGTRAALVSVRTAASADRSRPPSRRRARVESPAR